GTIFYVSIPVVKATTPVPESKSTSNTETSLPADLRCLLVDDNPINILYLQHILKKHISDIHTANDGLAAISKLEEFDFDIVLTDITMPGMNGIELLKHIRRQPAWQHIPVFAISADGTFTSRQTNPEFSFDGMIMKPFVERDLLNGINSALKRRQGAAIRST